MTRKFNFGEIWLADLNPKVGTELGKLRPVLIYPEPNSARNKSPFNLNYSSDNQVN
jgi:mRNA-degrading endonuclease toxin of MazEF toxin-antitoxin module